MIASLIHLCLENILSMISGFFETCLPKIVDNVFQLFCVFIDMYQGLVVSSISERAMLKFLTIEKFSTIGLVSFYFLSVLVQVC